MKYRLILLIIIINYFKLFSLSPKLEMRGVDISYLAQQKDCEIQFYKNGKATPILQILNEAGVNWIRLRLWHTPAENWNNLEHTLKTAQEIKAAEFNFLLDIHYSDTWADPNNQKVPKAWEKLNFAELCSAVEEYTFDVLKRFNEANCLPDMIQIGNEITNGMLWQHGKLSDKQGIKNFTVLLKKASLIIRKNFPEMKIMLHIDRGDNGTLSTWFFNIIKNNNIDYDIIGLSYYSYWNGKNLQNVGKNIRDLKKRFSKDVCIVETSYMWTLNWKDNCNNIAGTKAQLIDKYPATPEGQKNYLHDICDITYLSGGCGIFWWEPTAVASKNFPSSIENTAWFDFDNNYNNTGNVFLNFK